MPLTSPYGPGALWLDLGVTGEWLGVTGTIEYRAIGRLPGVDLYTTPYESSSAIESSARVWVHRLGVNLSYSLSFAEFSAAPALVVDDGVASFELELGAALFHSFRKERESQ